MDEHLTNRLNHSLQALAAPADAQIGLFPGFVVVADELALDFDNWSRVALQADLGDKRRSALIGIGHELSMLEEHKHVWTIDGLKDSQDWERVRALAREALDVFGWEVATPPSYGHEFVQAQTPDDEP